jgi:hypothetical protein
MRTKLPGRLSRPVVLVAQQKPRSGRLFRLLTKVPAETTAESLRNAALAADSPANTLLADRSKLPAQLQKAPATAGTARGPVRTSSSPSRAWIDVSKIIYVPDGQLAPNNTTQIGPNLFYPLPGRPGFVVPRDPVQHPLDIADIRQVAPGQLLPPGYKQLLPGWGAPDPDAFFQPAPPSTPKEPINIRDVIQVPPGQLAPWGYVQYLPGWFTPGPQLTHTPTIPQPR